MLTPDAIAAAARTSLEMHRSRARYRPFDAALRAAPLEDAYRIQDALHRLLAEAGRGEIVGLKIALPSKAMQQMTGVDQPAAGAIFSKLVHTSPARVDVAAYHHLGVEFEGAGRGAPSLPGSGGRGGGGRGRARPWPTGLPSAWRRSSWSRTVTPTTRRSTPSRWSRRTHGMAASCWARRARTGVPSISRVRRRAAGSTTSPAARAKPQKPR